MRLLSKNIFLLAVLICIMPFAAFAHDYTVENQPQVLEKALVLENCGILKQKDNGYLYLEVTNDFIAEILPLIQCEGRIVPPRHYTSKKGIGAHVSVMYENERIENEIWNVCELGNSYSFIVKELRTVKISRNGKMKKLWLLAVEAPMLEELRENYGLSNKLKGHDFHITIGTQLPLPVINPQEEGEFFISLDEEVYKEAA